MDSHLPLFLIRLTNIRIPLLPYATAAALYPKNTILKQHQTTCVHSIVKRNEIERKRYKKRNYDPNVLFSFSLFSITSSAPSPSKLAKQQSHIFQIEHFFFCYSCLCFNAYSIVNCVFFVYISSLIFLAYCIFLPDIFR